MPNPLGIKTGPVAQGFKIGQPDGKQLAALWPQTWQLNMAGIMQGP